MSKRPRPPASTPTFEPVDAGSGNEDDEPMEDDEDDDEFDEEAPRVVVGTVADLGRWIPATVGAEHGERPVWFLLESDVDLVGLFDRYPEGPMASRTTATILGALRSMSVERNAALQGVLGVTDQLRYGFHVSASLADVVESFEDDGFEVVMALRDGRIDLGDE